MPTSLPLVLAAGADAGDAERLAAELGGDTLSEVQWRSAAPPLVLWLDEGGLALRGSPASRALPVRPAPPAPRRGRDPLLRVLGRPGEAIDATGGFLGDAAVMAAAGWRVVVFERHPAIAAIAREALRRWRAAGNPAADRLELVEGDALALLGSRRSEVLYLDPMYPLEGRHGAARRNEPLHLLSALVGEDPDQGGLWVAARRAARRRVVVKRPRGAPPLGPNPSGSQLGRTVRFDIYPPLEVPE